MSDESKEMNAKALNDPLIWERGGNSLFDILEVSFELFFNVQQSKHITKIFYKMCAETLNNTQLIEDLKGQKFDLGVTEFFDACGVGNPRFPNKFTGIFHQIGLKNTVVTSSSMLFETLATAIGAPLDAAYVPGAFLILNMAVRIYTCLINR